MSDEEFLLLDFCESLPSKKARIEDLKLEASKLLNTKGQAYWRRTYS
jgi:hypothetical protein